MKHGRSPNAMVEQASPPVGSTTGPGLDTTHWAWITTRKSSASGFVMPWHQLEEDFWAADRLMSLGINQPEHAWLLLLRIKQ
jgi:hypothetical protein